MKIASSRKRLPADELLVFSGKVRITITGMSTTGHGMTDRTGLAARGFTLDETTVEEVYHLFYSVVGEVQESSDAQHEFIQKLRAGARK